MNAVSEGQCLFILLSMATGGLRGVADGNMEWKDRWKKVFLCELLISIQMAAVSERERH